MPNLFGVEPLTPSYGRDYKGRAAVLADLNAGKDFQTPSGQATSAAELRKMGVERIQVRYKRLTECFVVDLSKDPAVAAKV